MPLPFPNLTNATSYHEVILYNNLITGDWFAIFILIMVWLIAFVSLGLWKKKWSIVSANIITFLISLFLLALNAIGVWVMLLLLVACIGSIFYVLKD